MRALARRTSLLDSVEWYTFARRFSEHGPPELLRFRPYAGRADARRRWVWLDPRPAGAQRTLRSLLVLRCIIDGRTGYVVDIERRSDESGNPVEHFSGLAFTLSDERQLDGWLRRLLSRLRDTRGVFAALKDECPCRVAVFIHPASGSLSPADAAARNALTKLRSLLFAAP